MALKQSCDKIVIDFIGVRMIDKSALEMLRLMNSLAMNLGVQFLFRNINDDLRGYISQFSKELEVCLSTEIKYDEYSR